MPQVVYSAPGRGFFPLLSLPDYSHPSSSSRKHLPFPSLLPFSLLPFSSLLLTRCPYSRNRGAHDIVHGASVSCLPRHRHEGGVPILLECSSRVHDDCLDQASLRQDVSSARSKLKVRDCAEVQAKSPTRKASSRTCRSWVYQPTPAAGLKAASCTPSPISILLKYIP